MFENVKIPKKITSPIKEAIFEIRYDGPYPGEALYGILFEIFKKIAANNVAEIMPIMQIPQQVRDIDPNLHYQPLYRIRNDQFAFSVGPHAISFSALEPYSGWSRWTAFFYPLVTIVQQCKVITKVERIGLRTLTIFSGNIFADINATLTVDNQSINTIPSSFHTEFNMSDTHILLNVGNSTNISGIQTADSLIDIDCIHQFDCSEDVFFASYKDALEKAHVANKQVFFGLLKEELVNKLNPEW
ncbi:TIGR04255 family protein [Breznakiellaceae bacterium SP9]